MKTEISLCMIAKDEEKSLEECLNKIQYAVNEIVIVDTGSKDKTKEIAKRFTKKVYNFEWCDDFSKARNFSISKATKDWILVLDPDEKISKEDLIKLKNIIKENKKDVLGYRLIQKTYYKNKIISIRGICRVFKNTKKSAKQISGELRNSKKNFLFPRNSEEFLRMPEIQRISEHDKRIKFIYPIHETVRESIKNLEGRIGKTGIVIKHNPKINKEKHEYYLRLLKVKKEKFPNSNVDKEIENEYNLFNPR